MARTLDRTRRNRGHVSAPVGLLLALALGLSGSGAEVVVFGPQTYHRQPGDPAPVTARFAIANPAGQYVLRVENNDITSAVISMNGRNILEPNDFSGKKTTTLEKPVGVRAGTNDLTIELRSQGPLTVTIVDTVGDTTPPTIAADINPRPNAAGWNNGPVTVTFTCADAGSGIAACPAPVTVTAEGASQPVSGTAVDKAGNTAAVTVTVNIDETPPAVSVGESPAPNANGWNNTPVTATFICTDGGSEIATCPQDRVITTDGANQTVSGTASDKAGNTASITTVPFNIDQTRPSITVGSGINVCPAALTGQSIRGRRVPAEIVNTIK